MRPDASDFGYSVGDARVFASRTPVGGGIPFGHDSGLPTLGSSDVLSSFRSSSTYAYTPASKAYYPAVHAYSTPYPEDFEFGIGVPSPSVMHQEPVSMLPGQWSSAARTKPPSSFSSVYLADPDGPYSGYHGAGMLHRPSQSSVSSDSHNFSFSGVAASLPLASTPGPDRLLPNPATRASTLPYPAALKSSTTAPTSTAANTLADVATAASYSGGFDPHGLPSYPGSTASSSLSSSHPSTSSRSNSDTYSAAEGIFSEQERSLQSQGPGFDMSSYTASPRRSSASGVGVGGSAAAGGGHGYVPAESVHEAAHHGHSSHHHLSGAYMGDAAGPSSSLAHRHGGQSVASGSGSASHAAHAEDRQVAVAGRH